MWINVEGVAVWVSSFVEEGYTLIHGREYGWQIIKNGQVVETIGLFFSAIRILWVEKYMPKTYAILKQELEKDERN